MIIRVFSFCLALAFLVVGSFAQSTNFTITPNNVSPGAYGTTSTGVVSGNHAVGVAQDAAPGFNFGSFASDGLAKSDIYFAPESLFGREVLLGEVSSFSYWTKKGSTHLANPADWYVNIYTKRYSGQIGSSFYGVRIGAEPYFSLNLMDPANSWNQWSTDTGDNQLRIFESTYSYFGSYTDPTWDTFITGTSLSGTRGPGVPYASQPILSFSVQTGSGWAAGFTGQIDGLRIELTDGSVANINFEPFLVASTRDACKKDGWITLKRADGTSFANQGDCVSYVNTGS